MGDEIAAIVIDNGSYCMRAGFAGDDEPKSTFRSVVGKPKDTTDKKSRYIGDEAQTLRERLALTYPIQQGIITDMSAMEAIWYYTFYNELRAAPEEHPVLLTDPPLNPKESREKITQIYFETFSVPAMYLSVQGLLALYAAGRTTGIVVDIGEGVCDGVIVNEGYGIPHATFRTDIGGRDLTDYMRYLLKDAGYTYPDREVVREIKEKVAYVALDPKKSEEECPEMTYECTDGSSVTLDAQRWKCTEALFSPSLIGRKCVGVHEAIYRAITKCDVDIRSDLYSNIVLSGGSTLFAGIEERITQEIMNLAPKAKKVKCVAPPERKIFPWIGGSILASLSTFQSMWISKEEYDESGPLIVHQKC
eukprot:TRINITY_DN989_c1_g4_i1.p1 TRINITY_DN989_c1_g4~~TRINITY_DN989_c1_g4_i1.p1  ORF type:complete len:362 (-),score=68.22 TRINITY_DN989_c1_g4_i1:45-1130(-)